MKDNGEKASCRKKEEAGHAHSTPLTAAVLCRPMLGEGRNLISKSRLEFVLFPSSGSFSY